MRWTVLAALLMACTSSAEPASVTSGQAPSASSVATSASAPAGSGTAAAADRTMPDPSPSGSVSTDADPPGVQPDGFDTTLARTTLADGTECEFCVWVADTAGQRSRGLMFVTDLGAADAMAFRYAAPHTGTFWMQNTVLPLSIAFFGPGGNFLTSFDMEPCTADPCPNHRTPEDFLVAVEVPQGELDDLGLVDGSTLELLDLPCNG